MYGLVTTFAPERIVYVGATVQHPAARIATGTYPVKRAEIRYTVLWAGDPEEMFEAERAWIERLSPPWNRNGGGGGRGHTIDVDRAVALYEEGLSVRQVAKRLGCHHATVARAIPEALRRSVGAGRTR